jgi:hypothetical protein
MDDRDEGVPAKRCMFVTERRCVGGVASQGYAIEHRVAVHSTNLPQDESVAHTPIRAVDFSLERPRPRIRERERDSSLRVATVAGLVIC